MSVPVTKAKILLLPPLKLPPRYVEPRVNPNARKPYNFDKADGIVSAPTPSSTPREIFSNHKESVIFSASEMKSRSELPANVVVLRSRNGLLTPLNKDLIKGLEAGKAWTTENIRDPKRSKNIGLRHAKSSGGVSEA